MSDDGGKRQVLNAFVGMTNIIDEKQIDDVMIKTFGTIVDILSDYCGPYGKFAVLTDPAKPTEQPTFTKDGLNIINAIEFISPMEKHVKDTMAYISQRVERESGDGTTSSMILVASVMRAIKESIKDKKISYHEFVKAYVLFSNEVINALNSKCLHATNEQETHSIAMAQAMTSSHGNIELSKCVAELYSKTPVQAWDYIIFERERLETDTDINFKVDESDYSCRSNIFDNRFYNTPHGDAFEIKGAELVVMLGQMISNSLEFNNVVNKLKDSIAKNKKLVIIAPDGADPKVREIIEGLIPPRGNNDIGIFNINVMSPNINDHVGLMVSLGIENMKEDQLAIFEDVEVTYKNGELKVFNIVESTDDMLHPNFHDKDSKLFKYLEMIEDFVDEYRKSKDANPMIDHIVRDARKIYNNILLQKQGHVVIGGAAYDNMAMFDVVQDTMKATRATLKEGASLGGYQLLKEILLELQTSYTDVFSTMDPDCIIVDLLCAFIEGIDKLTECTAKHIPSADAEKLKAASIGGGSVYNVAIKCIRTLEDALDSDACAATVLQPVTVDREMIRRFGEVALKFMFTNRVIIPGGVVVDKKEGEN